MIISIITTTSAHPLQSRELYNIICYQYCVEILLCEIGLSFDFFLAIPTPHLGPTYGKYYEALPDSKRESPLHASRVIFSVSSGSLVVQSKLLNPKN
jgi:hypothetical protein